VLDNDRVPEFLQQHGIDDLAGAGGDHGGPGGGGDLDAVVHDLAVSTFRPLTSVVIDSVPNVATTFPLTGQIKRFPSRRISPVLPPSSRFSRTGPLPRRGCLFESPAGTISRSAARGGVARSFVVASPGARSPASPSPPPSPFSGILSCIRGRHRRLRFGSRCTPGARSIDTPLRMGFGRDDVDNLARRGDEDDAAHRDIIGLSDVVDLHQLLNVGMIRAGDDREVSPLFTR